HRPGDLLACLPALRPDQRYRHSLPRPRVLRPGNQGGLGTIRTGPGSDVCDRRDHVVEPGAAAAVGKGSAGGGGWCRDCLVTSSSANWMKTRISQPRTRRPLEGLNSMARNFKELQAKMDPVSREDNMRRLSEELQRMALEEVRGARQLTQAPEAKDG